MAHHRLPLVFVLLGAAAPLARPALFHRAGNSTAQRAPAITLRKRLHVNTLITQPDTFDIEWGGAFSTGGDFTLPAAIKFTPEGSHVYWGRTEFSVAFDSAASTTAPGYRVTNFSDRATFAATCVAHDGEKLDIAIAPQTSILLRGDSGARLGATAIARYDAGRSSAGVTATWTAATASSATNPAATLDFGAGYGYQLKSSGPLSHLTPHLNWLWERSTGIDRQISVFEGMEYQVTEKVAVDFSAAHFSICGGPIDHQVVIGLTVNTGRLHEHR